MKAINVYPRQFADLHVSDNHQPNGNALGYVNIGNSLFAHSFYCATHGNGMLNLLSSLA